MQMAYMTIMIILMVVILVVAIMLVSGGGDTAKNLIAAIGSALRIT